MSTFLDKIKRKTSVLRTDEDPIKKDRVEEVAESRDIDLNDSLQLDVDIYETSSKIVICAPVPGIDLDELDVFVEGENDVITIKGVKNMPEAISGESQKKEYLRNECEWGEFYRQIMLPQEININKIDASLEQGILVLKLPLLRIQTNGRKRIKIKRNK